MNPLPASTSDLELIAYVDRWATLLEKEDYAAAFAFTDHDPAMHWTPEVMKLAIKGYGEALPTQRVTLEGKPTDIRQRKEVTRWSKNRLKGIGEVSYDLNIDGFVSDLTAIFWIVATDRGLLLQLNDIHVL